MTARVSAPALVTDLFWPCSTRPKESAQNPSAGASDDCSKTRIRRRVACERLSGSHDARMGNWTPCQFHRFPIAAPAFSHLNDPPRLQFNINTTPSPLTVTPQSSSLHYPIVTCSAQTCPQSVSVSCPLLNVVAGAAVVQPSAATTNIARQCTPT